MPERHRFPASHPLELGLQILGALLAVAGFVALELTEDPGVCLALFGAGIAGATALSSLVWCVVDPGGIALRLERMRATRRYDPILDQLDVWAVRPRSLWLPTALAVPLMLLSLPIAFHTAPGDSSIFLVLLALIFFVAPVADLFGFLIWGLVLFPVVLICRATARLLSGDRSHKDDRYAVGLALILLGTLTFAVTLVVSTPDSGSVSSHGPTFHQLLALLGLSQDGVTYPIWLWVARGALLGIVGGALLVLRTPGRGRTLKDSKAQSEL